MRRSETIVKPLQVQHNSGVNKNRATAFTVKIGLGIEENFRTRVKAYMEWTIAQATQPSYFISYSRKQSREAVKISQSLLSKFRHVWWDRDQIAPGEQWLKVVEEGIRASDEMILIVSDDSLSSDVVRQEVMIAKTAQRTIRPYIEGKLTLTVPWYLADLHLDEIADSKSPIQTLQDILAIPYNGSNKSAKECLSQRVFPEFEEPEKSSQRVFLQKLYPTAKGLARNCRSDSIATLNSGLIACQLGQWTPGLEYLGKYARDKQHPVGWYYFLCHICRRRSMLHVPADCRSLVLESYEQLKKYDSHPLCNYLCLLTEVGLLNHGEPAIVRRLSCRQINELSRCESKSEIHRLIWLTGRSMPLLGSYAEQLKITLREVLI